MKHVWKFARYIILPPVLLCGCVTIPGEYRYYSHQTKSMMQLPGDRQMCLLQMAHKAKAAGIPSSRKIDWVELDRCLEQFGWKRMP